ncbi:MAG: hypothetical protein EBZ51_06225 [Synechococcaceae bacterium WB9_2_112]|nr:hypothetical protein [Synechococcaceae bacterium WB9_2_112]
MIELTELQSEQICGGRSGRAGMEGRGRGLSLLGAAAPVTNTSTATSLSSVLNVNPQINVAVNLAMFSSSIFNSQGNGSALVVA